MKAIDIRLVHQCTHKQQHIVIEKTIAKIIAFKRFIVVYIRDNKGIFFPVIADDAGPVFV